MRESGTCSRSSSRGFHQSWMGASAGTADTAIVRVVDIAGIDADAEVARAIFAGVGVTEATADERRSADAGFELKPALSVVARRKGENCARPVKGATEIREPAAREGYMTRRIVD